MQKSVEEFARLVEIIAKLRGPDGCPWDKQQTHSSLREFLLQESYEVLESLDEADQKKLCQELGDLFLQIMLHAQIAQDNSEFTLADVINQLNTKLIRRHPHIFGDVKVKNAQEVVHNWEDIKKTERQSGSSVIESVPRSMPAMAYSHEIQRRAAETGFDWENLEGVIEKLAEEVSEFRQAATQTQKEEEFGDLFFTLVNIAGRLGMDPESALRKANQKFYGRFSAMEKLAHERGLTFNRLNSREQNQLWDEVKRQGG